MLDHHLHLLGDVVFVQPDPVQFRVYVIDAMGGVSHPAEKYFTKIKGPPGDMIVDFREGKLERWSIAGDRITASMGTPRPTSA
jgi:hypothetical protein